jgi:amidohydrolase
MSELAEKAQANFSALQGHRRFFHAHPELGFEEYQAQKIIIDTLNNLGLKDVRPVGKTGVLGHCVGKHPGPVVLVRFDMDALPVQEANDVPYRSSIPGKMHACGHDGHMAIGLVLAEWLSREKESLNGTVKFLFQPAEEGLGGAQAVLQDGALSDPTPDAVLALHVWNEKPVGWVGLVPGPLMAASDLLEIEITGQGGHGALPHVTIDPVVAAASLVTSLQTIVSRNVSPLENAVISVTQILAGDAHNVIPGKAVLRGSIRTFLPEIRSYVHHRIREMVTHMADAYRCSGVTTITTLTPAITNNPVLIHAATEVCQEEFPALTIDGSFRTMVSEDMAYLMQDIPGAYLMIGSANTERGLTALHHNQYFDFDEQALVYGLAILCGMIQKIRCIPAIVSHSE